MHLIHITMPNLLGANSNFFFNLKTKNMKKRNGLLAVLAVLLCAAISNGQTNYVKRVNCGDTGATSHNGETYDADDGNGYTFTGDNKATSGHSNFTLKTNPGEIWAKTRYTKLTSMDYSFPVQDGDYEVILHWAEPYHGTGLSGNADDHRQFDVNINGTNVEDNLCVYCTAGLNQSMSKTYSVTASGGNGVTIEFAEGLVSGTRKNDPIINAIEVLGVAPTNIPVNSVSLNPTSLGLDVGNTGQLTPTILPNDATNQNVSWSSDQASITSVNSSGLVTAHAVGTATITVATVDGNKTAQATVTVSDPNASSTPAGDLWQTYDDVDTFLGNGNVGIGTDPQSDYRLAVNGDIRAKKIKVETNWADYVFENDYDLPSLEEVKTHIDEKGHLMNIPSAEEVEANGIELGEMNKLLLEKIEELTLYILEQESRIQELELSIQKK